MRWIASVALFVSGLTLTSCSGPESSASIAALGEKIDQLEMRLLQQEDIENIRALQYAYNYYNQSGLHKQAMDLVSDNAESIEIGGRGVYYGKEGFIRAFATYAEDGVTVKDRVKNFGNVLFQVASMDVIKVAPDRGSATCRLLVLTPIFRGFPDNTQQKMNAGIYEMKYVRENDKWMISKFKYVHVFSATWGKNGEITPGYSTAPDGTQDAPTTWYHPWPETGVLPFSFPNPVTGEYPSDNVNPTRYWIGNWSEEEFGTTGVRPAEEWSGD